MASDYSTTMSCSMKGLDGDTGIDSYIQVRLPQTQYSEQVACRAPVMNTPPSPIQSQSCEIYDFFSSSLVTPLPAVRTSLPQALSIGATSCDAFEFDDSSYTKPSVRLPGSIEIFTRTASPCCASSSISPSLQLAGPLTLSKPGVLPAFLSTNLDHDEHTTSALALDTDDDRSRASEDNESTSSSSSCSQDEPLSPTFSGETPPSVGPRTPPPLESHEVDFERALKSLIDEFKFRTVLNNIRFTTGGDYDTESLFPASEPSSELSASSNDLEERIPVTSAAFVPSYSELNAAINSASNELRTRDAGCHINFFCVQESDREDRGEVESSIAGVQEPEHGMVVEVSAVKEAEQLPEPMNTCAATVVHATEPRIHTFTTTSLGSWADEDDEDDSEAYVAFWNKHIPTSGSTIDECSTYQHLDSTSGESERQDVSLSQQLSGEELRFTDDLNMFAEPVEESEHTTPQSRLAAARHRLENNLEYHEHNFDSLPYHAPNAQPKLQYSARQIAQTYGNCSFDLFEPTLSRSERLNRLRALRGSEVSSASSIARKMQKHARQEERDVKEFYEHQHFQDLAKDDYDDAYYDEGDERRFDIRTLAVRRAEFHGHRELLVHTATTAFEYEWATAPESLCADFAAITLLSCDDDEATYAVSLVNDDDHAHLCGTYKHYFYTNASHVKCYTTKQDINRRFCLLRAAVWHFHDWTWSERGSEDRAAAREAVKASKLMTWQATAAYPSEAAYLCEQGAPYRIVYPWRDFRGHRRSLLESEAGWKTYLDDVKHWFTKSNLSHIESVASDDAMPSSAPAEMPTAIPITSEDSTRDIMDFVSSNYPIENMPLEPTSDDYIESSEHSLPPIDSDGEDGEASASESTDVTDQESWNGEDIFDFEYDDPLEVDTSVEMNDECDQEHTILVDVVPLEESSAPKSLSLPATPRTPRDFARPGAPTPSRGLRGTWDDDLNIDDDDDNDDDMDDDIFASDAAASSALNLDLNIQTMMPNQLLIVSDRPYKGAADAINAVNFAVPVEEIHAKDEELAQMPGMWPTDAMEIDASFEKHLEDIELAYPDVKSKCYLVVLGVFGLTGALGLW